jgi:hypothetical protein
MSIFSEISVFSEQITLRDNNAPACAYAAAEKVRQAIPSLLGRKSARTLDESTTQIPRLRPPVIEPAPRPPAQRDRKEHQDMDKDTDPTL